MKKIIQLNKKSAKTWVIAGTDPNSPLAWPSSVFVEGLRHLRQLIEQRNSTRIGLLFAPWRASSWAALELLKEAVCNVHVFVCPSTHFPKTSLKEVARFLEAQNFQFTLSAQDSGETDPLKTINFKCWAELIISSQASCDLFIDPGFIPRPHLFDENKLVLEAGVYFAEAEPQENIAGKLIPNFFCSSDRMLLSFSQIFSNYQKSDIFTWTAEGLEGEILKASGFQLGAWPQLFGPENWPQKNVSRRYFSKAMTFVATVMLFGRNVFAGESKRSRSVRLGHLKDYSAKDIHVLAPELPDEKDAG